MTAPPAAPWTLTGEGFILPVRGPAGLAVLMLVDYVASPVGPYRELLSLPARLVATPHGRHPSIDRIVVDSTASVVGGRANWGIPKELAACTWERDGPTTSAEWTQDGRTTARLVVRAGRLAVPGPLALLPERGRTIGQHLDGSTFITTLSGSGRLARASVRESWFDAAAWPALAGGRALPGVHARSFTMTFGVPRVTTTSG